MTKVASHAFRGVPLGWRVGVSHRPCGETHRSRMFTVWCLLRACRRQLATHWLAPLLTHRGVQCISLRGCRCCSMCIEFRSEIVRDRPDQDPACKFTDVFACWPACKSACLCAFVFRHWPTGCPHICWFYVFLKISSFLFSWTGA